MIDFFLIGVALTLLAILLGILLGIGGAFLANWLFPHPLDLSSFLDDEAVK